MISGRVYPVGYPFLYGFECEVQILAPLTSPASKGKRMGTDLTRRCVGALEKRIALFLGTQSSVRSPSNRGS